MPNWLNKNDVERARTTLHIKTDPNELRNAAINDNRQWLSLSKSYVPAIELLLKELAYTLTGKHWNIIYRYKCWNIDDGSIYENQSPFQYAEKVWETRAPFFSSQGGIPCSAMLSYSLGRTSFTVSYDLSKNSKNPAMRFSAHVPFTGNISQDIAQMKTDIAASIQQIK
jgi:hypothetical protein